MRVFLVLALLAILALLASSRRLWALRRGPLGAVLLTGGWAAVAVGLLLGPHAIGVVDAEVREEVRPLVHFGLGWVGLLLGFQAHRSLPRVLPAGAARHALADVVVSVLVVGGAALAVLHTVAPAGGWTPLLAPAALLGVAAIGWPPEARSLAGDPARAQAAVLRVRAVSGLGSLFAVALYGGLFRLRLGLPPDATGWQVVGGSLLLAVGIAAATGVLIDVMMRLSRRSEGDFLVVLLGSTAFGAGAAVTLGQSPLFVGALTGAVVVNLPSGVLDKLKRAVLAAEQPIAMALLLLAGTLADPRLGAAEAALAAALLVGRLSAKLVVGVLPIARAAQAAGAASGALSLAPLRQAPLAPVFMTGWLAALAPTASLGPGPGKLLTVVILVGLGGDVLALALARRRVRGAASGEPAA